MDLTAAAAGWGAWAAVASHIQAHADSYLAVFAVVLVLALTPRVLGFVGGHIDRYLASRCAAEDQVAATRQAPFYFDGIQLHPALLEMDLRELARRLELRPVEVRFLLRSPHLIPHLELLPKLEAALLLPRGWFETGGDYGDQRTYDRLLDFHRRGRSAFTAEDLEAFDQGARRDVLRVVERTTKKELGLLGEGRGQ